MPVKVKATIRKGTLVETSQYVTPSPAPDARRMVVAQEPTRSIWQLAADWLGNEAARLVEGDAPDETIRYRLTVCTGFDEHGKPVGARCPKCVRGKDGADYCGSCGCAEWKRARLTPEGGDLSTSKLAFPALVCPLGRFKAVRGRRKAAADG